MMPSIENPMVSRREPKAQVCAVCRLCLRDILEGDEIYDMPDGAIICEDCLEDWAQDYRKTAGGEWQEQEREEAHHGGAL